MYSHGAIYAAISAVFLTSIVVSALPDHVDVSPSDTDLMSTRSVQAPPLGALEKKSVGNGLNDGGMITNIFARVTAMGNGWEAHWNALDMIKPEVPTALEALIALYQGFIRGAHPIWAQNGQLGVSAALGGLSLTIWSNAPISWDWIVTFVADTVSHFRIILAIMDTEFMQMVSTIQAYAAGVLIGSYRVMFVNRVTAVTVGVSLGLPNNPAI